MVNLERHPVYMDYAGRGDFILRAREAGHLDKLSERQRFIIEQRYLEERSLTYRRIGELLNPPRSSERVRQIDIRALSILHILNKGSRHPDEIGSLGLPERVYNALIRSQITTLGQITFMSDAELLGLRNFGAKSLQELKEKLASRHMNQPAAHLLHTLDVC